MILHFKEFCNLIGNLRMPSHSNQNWWYQLTDNIDVYPYAKN